DAGDVQNLGGWLTTIVARVCLDMLRSRASRRELPLATAAEAPSDSNLEDDVVLADEIGPALLIVLETLAPAERVAFVLHDMFSLSFEEIAPIINRTPAATRQLASRARRRIRGAYAPATDTTRQRELVGAFLAASRDGDYQRLVELLSPDAVLRADNLAVHIAAANRQHGAPNLKPEVRGAELVADAFKGRARAALRATIDGEAGAVWAVGTQVRTVFLFTIERGKITGIDLIMNPEHLAELAVKID
ncbi:MAG TPA: sigma factor-like helix-turn-helix DNA-binding protein, partial [Steroidobacteraceae bacterium]|nr:sigma factor-like helix-turn-helix DNA-binding protein [Steroidobacteraceae bacterium]